MKLHKERWQHNKSQTEQGSGTHWPFTGYPKAEPQNCHRNHGRTVMQMAQKRELGHSQGRLEGSAHFVLATSWYGRVVWLITSTVTFSSPYKEWYARQHTSGSAPLLTSHIQRRLAFQLPKQVGGQKTQLLPQEISSCLPSSPLFLTHILLPSPKLDWLSLKHEVFRLLNAPH